MNATTSAAVSFPAIDAVITDALNGTLPVSATPAPAKPLPEHVTTAVNSSTSTPVTSTRSPLRHAN